jgi:L-ascorbate metabolism protein UlaG (beta-lactamase superfamily)
MVYKVLASGSTGNAVLYHNLILVDIGVPFSLVKPYLNSIQLILLTHEHHDHINWDTLKRIVFERPSMRIGCCNSWFETLQGRNIDRYEIGKVYDYTFFSICPIKLYHDVLNCGYRIFKGDHKIIHCTDTAHLNGISAKGYDLYALEHNYNEDTVFNDIEQKEQAGEFTHQKNAIKSHLSEQQARKFIFENKGDNYEVLRLHESKIT